MREWPLHLGHVAGCYLPPDIQFRFERAIGNKVLMVSGSDEHGTPITVTAEQQGVAPRRVVDEFHAMNYQALLDLGCSWSMSVDPRGVEYGGALFNRTSDPRHKSMVQENFSALEQGVSLNVKPWSNITNATTMDRAVSFRTGMLKGPVLRVSGGGCSRRSVRCLRRNLRSG